MGGVSRFNPAYDFRRDARGGDPNARSHTLRSYHRLLWQKPLPSGEPFTLTDAWECGEYLVHESVLDRFSLVSDSCVTTWSTSTRGRIADIVSRLPEEDVERHATLTSQMGAKLLFPRNGPGEFRGMTMSQARDSSGYLAGRWDLTLECIRLHYLQRAMPGSACENPLADAMDRWSDFFDLFGDFAGYVDFFLLQDLLTPDGRSINFFLPFDGFTWWPFPADDDEYAAYIRKAVAFVQARNRRMKAWVEAPQMDAPRLDGHGGELVGAAAPS